MNNTACSSAQHSVVRAVMWRTAVFACAMACSAWASAAAPGWKPDKTVEFIIPGGAGGGQDRTGRIIQKFMQDNGLVTTPMLILNKTGGGGNLAYAYLSQYVGDAHFMATATATLLTNHILGISPRSHTDLTVLCLLYSEYIGFAVNAESPIKTGRDLIERVKKNPESIAFAFGTSRGNANHIAIALAMKAAGIDPTKLKIVLFKASIDAATALMGGHVDVVATPTSTYAPLMASGKLRIIAVAAPRRISGQFAAVPTWKEQEIDVVAPGHRMLVAPKGLNPAQLAFWDGAFARLAQSEVWKKELDENEWENAYLNSTDSRKAVDEIYAQYRKVLVELGLAK